MKTTQLPIEVVYAGRGKEIIISLVLAAGATVKDALQASQILDQNPDIAVLEDGVGIFGKVVTFDTPLRPGDRVEIYRPLHQDPKEARRKRGTTETRQAKKEKRVAKDVRRTAKRKFRKQKMDGEGGLKQS